VKLEQALEVLKKNGFKYTDKRESMIHIFQKHIRYLTAKEILDYMQEDYPGISFDTIYRNLSIFERLGIIEATEWQGERRFRISCSDEDKHHHHLICTECGKTLMLHICPMNAILGEPENFEITGHKFEIYGKCADCNPEASKSH
jgi:Fur family transcriptional regulator, zinc uptake regulator